MKINKGYYFLAFILLVGISFLCLSKVYGASEVRIDQAWLSAAGNGPYKLTRSDTIYVLDSDIATQGSAFLLGSSAGCPKNVTLDLNGHTITYADMDFTGVVNQGFEEGDSNDPKIPVGWDLSGAHGHAARQDYTKKLFFDNYSLRIDNVAGDAYPEESVLSSPVSLTAPGKYAITAEVQGGPYNVLDSHLEVSGLAVSCANKVSNMHMAYGGDMAWGLICEFDISSPVTVRGKIVVGTKDETKNTNLNVDEMDIRPIDDAASSLNPSGFAKYLGMAGIKTNTWNCSMAEIKNGKIIEGKSKAIYSSAITATGAKKVHDLTIITAGINSENIAESYNSNMEIYNNYLEANGKLPLNRQYFFSMIDLGHTSGGNKIYNNTLLNGPHVGINHGNAKSGTLNPYKSEVYNNTIKLNINSTNGFSINVGSNMDVHDNIIQPVHGHGLGLLRDSSEVKIYDNLIEPRTWPCSEYASYVYPNSAHGIRIKNYNSGAITNLEIFNNTIIGKTTPQLPNCYTEVSGITNYLLDDSGGKISQNVKIHDNDISVETDNYMQQHAMAYKSMGQGEFYSNTLKSNHIIVEMSDNDAGGANNYKYFHDNTLIKGDNPQGFHTLRYGYGAPVDNLFTDTILQNGADLKDISLGINGMGFSYTAAANLAIGWTLKINTKDNTGAPLQGVSITIKDKDNNLISQLSSDEQSSSSIILKEYTFSAKTQASKSYQYFTPYGISATKDGYNIFSQKININQPTNLAIQLDPSNFPLVSDTAAPVCSSGMPTGILAAGTTQTNLTLFTNENATCRYSTAVNTAYGSMTNTFAITGSTEHSTLITNLTAGASYSYYIRCSDAHSNANTGDYIVSFSVANQENKNSLIISQISASSITSSGATITWQTDETSTSKVEYGLTVAYGKSTNEDSNLFIAHSVTLTCLESNTTYHFRVVSANQAKNESKSQDLTFTTLSISEDGGNRGGGGGATGGNGGGSSSGNNNGGTGSQDSGAPNGTSPQNTVLPPAPAPFNVSPSAAAISLSWQNPKGNNFSKVLIVRKEGSAPESKDDGTVIYQGSGQNYMDKDLQNGKQYFYGIFSADKNNNYSKVIVAAAKLAQNAQSTQNTQNTQNTNTLQTEGATLNIKSLYGQPKEMAESISLSEAQKVYGHNKFVTLDNMGKSLYLKVMSLTKSPLADNGKYSIAMFINEGTETTKFLGAGERAGVISSYQQAFNKLPRSESEWQDVIKIANGRWPAEKNETKEKETKEKVFIKIYKRTPNMNNANDNAAVTIITYGLRPVTRNVENEKAGIRSFKGIYGYNPVSAADWDIVRAIAYSGAKR